MSECYVCGIVFKRHGTENMIPRCVTCTPKVQPAATKKDVWETVKMAVAELKPMRVFSTHHRTSQMITGIPLGTFSEQDVKKLLWENGVGLGTLPAVGNAPARTGVGNVFWEEVK